MQEESVDWIATQEEEGLSLEARREEDVDWIDEPKKNLLLGRQELTCKKSVDWIDTKDNRRELSLGRHVKLTKKTMS